MLEDNYKLGEGATPGDKAGFTMKQLFAKPSPNPDSEFLFHQLISYAVFPPIVPPIRFFFKHDHSQSLVIFCLSDRPRGCEGLLSSVSARIFFVLLMFFRRISNRVKTDTAEFTFVT